MRFHKEFVSNRMIQFVIGILLASGTASAVTYRGWSTLLAAAAGIILFVIFEYVTHRFLLHEFPQIAPRMHAGHVAHHQHPKELKYLFGPVHYDVMAYAAYFLVLLALCRQFSLAAAAVFGTSAMQMYYQWIHYASHRPVKLWSPWSKWMKKKHLLHHHLDEQAWYGVSNPTMDYLLGTWKTATKSKRPKTEQGRRNPDPPAPPAHYS